MFHKDVEHLVIHLPVLYISVSLCLGVFAQHLRAASGVQLSPQSVLKHVRNCLVVGRVSSHLPFLCE